MCRSPYRRDDRCSDTKHASSPTLSFTRAEWDAFVQGVKKGEFDA
ncbi:DUF397 domain-containing protein [Candidatus Kaiserbacteria bacterium]|nr:DUF397 domain-containing protein [Candidatus Kaiserbacteria bacterium]